LIPLRDSIRSRTTPVVTVGLIIINVLVFLKEVSLGSGSRELLEAFGFVPARFVLWADRGGDPLSPFRFIPIFTAMFLHGGWAHIIGNMLYLWIFGDNVEDRLGHLRYLLFYLLCGTIAFATQTLATPDSTVPAIGASGAIAGVLGAYFILYPRSRVLTLVPIFIIPWFVEIPAVVYLGLWFILQLFSGAVELTSHAGQVGGVAWWAHAGGFVSGIILCLVLRKRKLSSLPPRVWA
jgi:membrane associated rhomboid family serine protease